MFNPAIESERVHAPRRLGFRDHFARGINHELASDVHLKRGEVERVQWCKWQEPHVIFRVESIPQLTQNGAKISGVAMLSDENHDLGQRKLSGPKQRHSRLQQFFRMTFLCCYHQQIVKTGARIRAHVHNIRIDDLDQGTNHFPRRNTNELVFLRRLANYRPRVDCVSAMCDFSNVKDGELCRVRVMSKVISKRSLHFSLARRNDTFKHEFRICRHHHVDRFGTNHRNPLAAKETRKSDFIDVLRQRQYRSHHENGVGADHDGHFEIVSFLLCFPIVTAPTFHALPMHAGNVFPKHL